ncbi:hypothetical protein VARIO8X_90068 [Burkholderiales bacterium 8X]|nr:hypothetical protein VARIO8X_90068 [Burkholderiales bacterium 8X]
MNNNIYFFSGGFGVFVVLVLIVLAVLWSFLPFAVFGAKPLIRELLEAQHQNNRLIEALTSELRQSRGTAAAPVGPIQERSARRSDAEPLVSKNAWE